MSRSKDAWLAEDYEDDVEVPEQLDLFEFPDSYEHGDGR